LRSFGELRGWPQDDSDGISIDSPGVGRPAPDFSNQVHDFDPGLDNRLFWTVPLDKNSVQVDPGSGRASLVVSDLEMEETST